MNRAKKSQNERDIQAYEVERDVLTAAGIPTFVVNYAISLRPSQWMYHLSAFSMIAIMLLGFALGALFWEPLEKAQAGNAIRSAEELGGLLYWSNFGVSPLIALFGWIFASGLIAYWTTNFSDRLRASVFVYSFAEPSNAAYARMMTRTEKLSLITEPDQYVRAVIGQWSKIAFWCAAFLVMLAGYSLQREFKTFSVYTADGYYAFPYFPWEDVKSGKWTDAAAVEIGCNHTDEDDNIIYKIRMRDGDSHRLDGTFAVGGSWLDKIEIIDASLVSAGAEFRRWSWLKRDPLHPDCLEAQRVKYGADDYERIRRLLRVDEI